MEKVIVDVAKIPRELLEKMYLNIQKNKLKDKGAKEECCDQTIGLMRKI